MTETTGDKGKRTRGPLKASTRLAQAIDALEGLGAKARAEVERRREDAWRPEGEAKIQHALKALAACEDGGARALLAVPAETE